MATELVKKEVIYPESDGRPMAETDTHRKEMINLLTMLEYHYRQNPKAYVAGDLFIYYEEGNANQKVAPDVFVVLGVENKDRRTYKIWEEGKAPDVIFELTSGSTQYEDLYAKMELYRRLGVKEYYLYDPTGDYLPELLQAYLLEEGRYRLLPPEGGRWRSPVLKLDLKLENGRLRLYDPKTGERLLTPAELVAARERAEAELQRLRQELARRKKKGARRPR